MGLTCLNHLNTGKTTPSPPLRTTLHPTPNTVITVLDTLFVTPLSCLRSTTRLLRDISRILCRSSSCLHSLEYQSLLLVKMILNRASSIWNLGIWSRSIHDLYRGALLYLHSTSRMVLPTTSNISEPRPTLRFHSSGITGLCSTWSTRPLMAVYVSHSH